LKIIAQQLAQVNPMYVDVYLNDVKQQLCIEADTEEGYVILLLTNENGTVKRVDGQALTERLEGAVKLVIEKRK
jgi:hypothetical protein